MGSFSGLIRRAYNWRRLSNTVPPYGVLGQAYDHMMRHVDYEGWAEYIETLIAHVGHGRRILDAGCGTGRLMSALAQRGFSVAGFDRSRSMIRQARQAAQAQTVVADMTAMPFNPGWDVVLSLYDVMLYLDLESVQAAAAQAAALLRPGGLFIFDAVTESLVLDYWRRFSERDRVGLWSYKRSSWYDRPNQLQHTRIRLRHRPSGRVWTEHHRQYIYDLETLASAVELAGLSPVGRFHEMTLSPGSEASGRVHFVFRREGV